MKPAKPTLATVGVLLFLTVAPTAPAMQKDQSKSGSSQPANFGEQVSGMYTFLREGEFVQVTVEGNKVSGFVSRYGDSESDRGAFLDQFFSEAALHAHDLTFITKPVHGTWYKFAGTISRGEAKTLDKEGYWIIRGKLTELSEDEGKHVTSKQREVTFKSFPQDLGSDTRPR